LYEIAILMILLLLTMIPANDIPCRLESFDAVYAANLSAFCAADSRSLT
jgi:hypothetical protein